MRNTVTTTLTLAAAGILTGAAVGCASTTQGHPTTGAAASPAGSQSGVLEFSGTYTVTFDDGLERTWTATPCGRGCADIEQTPKPFGAKAQARSNGDLWILNVSSPTEVVCDDNSLHQGISTWRWDPETLEGTFHTQQTVDACGDPAGDVFDEHDFTLAES
jgi:hypothetical protein